MSSSDSFPYRLRCCDAFCINTTRIGFNRYIYICVKHDNACPTIPKWLWLNMLTSMKGQVSVYHTEGQELLDICVAFSHCLHHCVELFSCGLLNNSPLKPKNLVTALGWRVPPSAGIAVQVSCVPWMSKKIVKCWKLILKKKYIYIYDWLGILRRICLHPCHQILVNQLSPRLILGSMKCQRNGRDRLTDFISLVETWGYPKPVHCNCGLSKGGIT